MTAPDPIPPTIEWAGDRVRLIDAGYAGGWELPVIGAVAAPTAVLVRPDGHVAWVGEKTDAGLADALTAWFGPPQRRSTPAPRSRRGRPYRP